MSVSVTEDALRTAVIAADCAILSSLPSDNQINHIFSKKFEHSMQKLILQYNRMNKDDVVSPKTWKKNWIAILAAVIMVITTAMSVSAIRNSVFEFVSQVYEKYSQIFFSQTSAVTQNSINFTECKPSYIPDGFQLVHSETNGLFRQEYENGTDMIFYTQQEINEASMHINTEGVELEDTKVNGLPAKYYSNQGTQNLIWYDNQYVYMVSSTLDRKTVFKIAENVQTQ